MKTLVTYAVLLLMVTTLTISSQAHATIKQDAADRLEAMRIIHIVEISIYCFSIPYTRIEVLTQWNTLMAFDVNRIAQLTVPLSSYNKELVKVEYYTQEDFPTSAACYYFRDTTLFSY